MVETEVTVHARPCELEAALRSSPHSALAWCFPSQTAILRRQGHYRGSTVPAHAQEEAQSLFVTEVMCFFDIHVRYCSPFFLRLASPTPFSLHFNDVFKTVSGK